MRSLPLGARPISLTSWFRVEIVAVAIGGCCLLVRYQLRISTEITAGKKQPLRGTAQNKEAERAPSLSGDEASSVRAAVRYRAAWTVAVSSSSAAVPRPSLLN